MDFFEVIRKRCSVRRFSSEPVREDDLHLMLETARLAPSAENIQPWRFIVIRDQELKEKLRDLVEASISAQVEAFGSELERRKLQERRFYATFFADAPVVIAVATYPFPRALPGQGSIFNQGLQSVAAAITQLHLAATALGYGSCWTTLPLEFAREEMEALLEMEPPWFLAALVAVGLPAEAPPPRPRKPLEEIVSFR